MPPADLTNAPAITPVLGAKCMLVVSRVDLAA
jgi:hypothetical protein